MTYRRLLGGICVALSLTACAPMVTQNPGQGWSPVNAIRTPESERVLLSGHDVVAYFTEKSQRLGNPKIRSRYKGVDLFFTSPENKALFDQAPEKYLPQYGGYCANGIVYGIPWGGDADTWLVIDNKLYIFGGQASKKAFELDIPGNLKLAQQYWDSEVNQANPLWQRAKRMVFRVPHYKSGTELAKMVAEKKP